MTLVARWWPALHRGPLALSGGRAPAWWRRQLAHDAAWLGDLARSGAWVGQFGTLWSALLDQPLWGRSLGLLAAEVIGPPETAGSERAAQRARARPEAGEPPSGRPTQRAEAPERRAASRLLASLGSGPPAGLPHEAGQALLERLAGSSARPLPAAPAAALRDQGVPVSPSAPERRRPRLAGRDMSSVDGGAATGWLGQELARRVARALASVSAGGGGPPADALRPGAPEVSAAPADWSESLGPGWSTPLDGPTAPLALLDRLATGRDQGVVTGPGTALPARRSRTVEAKGSAGRGGGAAPLAPRGDGVESPLTASLDRPSPGVSKPAPGLVGEDRPFPRQAADVFALLREVAPEPGAGTALTAEGTPRATAEIAPPTLAERLPPLALPPDRGTSGLPVAAAMAWAGARAEAAAPEDDLEALAAKIKRILDEEARRYGIDV